MSDVQRALVLAALFVAVMGAILITGVAPTRGGSVTRSENPGLYWFMTWFVRLLLGTIIAVLLYVIFAHIPAQGSASP